MAGKKKKAAKRATRKTTGKPVDVSAAMDDAKAKLETPKPLSAKDIPSGGGLMGIPLILKEHEDQLELHHKTIAEIAKATEEAGVAGGKMEAELAELKTKFAKMEKMFYLPGPEGGADEV